VNGISVVFAAFGCSPVVMAMSWKTYGPGIHETAEDAVVLDGLVLRGDEVGPDPT
jgi:hypothetical protein